MWTEYAFSASEVALRHGSQTSDVGSLRQERGFRRKTKLTTISTITTEASIIILLK